MKDRPPRRIARRAAVVLLVAIAAGCADEAAPPSPRSAATFPDTPREAPRPAAGNRPAPLVAMAPGGAGTSGHAALPEGRWSLRESYPPVAAWGVPDSEAMLTFACDGAGHQLVLERQAVGVPDSVRLVSIDADGTRLDYPAERIEATLAPNLVTRIALDAPILDRLLGARRIEVLAGEDAIVATAPGAALRPVVEACRRGADAAGADAG